MSRNFRSLGMAALAMFVAATALAAPAQAKRTTASTAAAPATHSVAGTLEKYDASGNSIVVNTGNGTETLSLGSDSSIRMGAVRMSAADLTAHTGQKVKVRYSDANGHRMVQTLQLEASPARSTRAQATTTPKK